MRHAHLLGAKDPLMHRLVPALVAEMGAAYPELVRAQPLIEATLKLIAKRPAAFPVLIATSSEKNLGLTELQQTITTFATEER